jgi:TP901 family phage tail tape measure protein
VSRVVINIGAAFAGSFKTVVGGAKRQLQTLGSSLQDMKARESALGRFAGGQTQLQQTRQQYQSLRQELEQLNHTIAAAGVPNKQQARQLHTLAGKVKEAEAALKKETRALQEQETALQKTGLDTRHLTAEQARLGASVRDVERRYQSLRQNELVRQANQQQRSRLRGQIFDMLALGAAVAAPISAAVKFESTMADVRKVVDFDSPQQFKAMQSDLLRLGTVMPMSYSGLGQIMATAGQAGVARQELLRFSEDAAKMGVAFDMSGIQAGTAMTGMREIFGLNQDGAVALGDAYNHLSNNMDATAAGIVNIGQRAGGTAHLIGMTGQQLGALSATFLALKTRPETAATSINALMMRLSTAEQQGAKFQNALERIGWSASDLKYAMETDAQSALLEFLETLRDSDDVMGTLTDLFGMEYSDDIAKLVGGLDIYRNALGLVAKETWYLGSMTEEYNVRSKTAENQLVLFRNQVSRLGIVIGSVLLPPLNTLLKSVGQVINKAAALGETFPKATTAIVGTAAGLVILKLGAIAGAYAFTFLRGAVLTTTSILALLRSSIIGTAVASSVMAAKTAVVTGAQWFWNAAITAGNIVLATQRAQLIGSALATSALAVKTAAVTTAQWLWNTALSANPIGLVIGAVAALGAAAYTIYSHWQPIMVWLKDKFGWIGDTIAWVGDQWDRFWGSGPPDASSAMPKPAARLEPVIKAPSLTALTAATALATTPVAAAMPPDIAPLLTPGNATQAAQPSTVHNNQQYNIHLQQHPGEDAEQLAQRVLDEINRQQEQRSQGALYDE